MEHLTLMFFLSSESSPSSMNSIPNSPHQSINSNTSKNEENKRRRRLRLSDEEEKKNGENKRRRRLRLSDEEEKRRDDSTYQEEEEELSSADSHEKRADSDSDISNSSNFQGMTSSISFLKDKAWPPCMDITLFVELKKAREQNDGYLGFSWKDDEMWEQVRSALNTLRTIDEIKDRVSCYKTYFSRFGFGQINLAKRDMQLITLGEDVFKTSMNIGPPVIPRRQYHARSVSSRHLSTSGSTSHNDRCQALKNELEKMICDTGITMEEFCWSLSHFSDKIPLFFSMDLQQRIKLNVYSFVLNFIILYENVVP